METYTVEGLSKLLKDLGYDVSTRTIKYYAYEKNMFPNLKAGKKSFTKAELDDIIKIQKLKNCTSLKLDEIKDLIKEKSIVEIDDYITSRYYKAYFNKKNFGQKPSLNMTIFNDKSISFSNNLNIENNIRNSFLENNQVQYNSFNCVDTLNVNLENKTNNTMSSIKTNDIDKSNNKRTIKVTEDITLMVNENINTEKLKEIVNFIKNL